jgi:hypothetical protein
LSICPLIHSIFFYLANHQRRTSIVSIEKDSNDETSRITNQSNTDFENDFSKINQKENIDE